MSEIFKAPDAKKSSLEERQIFWKRVISLYETSGLSPSEFCRGHEIDSGQIHRWHRILHRDEKQPPVEQDSNSSFPLFSQIQVAQDKVAHRKTQHISLLIKENICITVDSDSDLGLLKRVVEVLN